MIKISLIYLTEFQEIVGRREEEIKIRDEAKLIDLLETLSAKYGKKFEEALFEPKNRRVRGYNHITLNGQLAHLVDRNMEIKLKEGDRVIIAHAVSGG